MGDVADLAHIKFGRHARRHVLPVGRGRKQDVGVVAGNGQHLGRDVFSQAGFEGGAIGEDDFAHASNVCSGSRRRGRVVARHQHVHIGAHGEGGSDGIEGGRFDRCVVVFCNNKGCHGCVLQR